jgi:D-alanyl-D-alanine carboxypeptidase
MDESALKRAADYIGPWLQYLYNHGDTPGFVVAISHKGKVIFNEAYGFADVENKKPMAEDHLFRIASHSKTFTATAVLQLQENGKLKINDPVSLHLTWLKDHKDSRWQKVTISQLLSHGAGVVRDGNDSNYWNVERSFPSEGDFKREMLETRLAIDNNTKLKYSNYGYTLLGLLIAEVSGMGYNDYVTKNIIEPLGLKNTGPEYDPARKHDYATGYTRMDDYKKRLPIEPIDTHGMSPATGFYSNTEDLCRYFTAHMPGSGQLLDDESKKEMQKAHWQGENTRDRIDYGLGLDIEYVDDRVLLGHGGGFPGNITKSLFDPKDKLVCIVLTNANGSWAGYMDKSIIKVIDFFQAHKDAPRWQKYAGRYSDLWHDLDFTALDDKLIVTGAGDWEPFKNPEELEHVREDVFRVSKTDSFSSFGEEVEFKMSPAGKVEKVRYTGASMLPEADYKKRMASKKRIG